MRVNKISTGSRILGSALLALSGAALQVPAVADDTEIYQATLSSGAGERPKVLIILDDSGSMDSLASPGGVKPAYDPGATYADAGYDDTKIYWSSDTSKPSSSTDQWFTASVNRCESSFAPLADSGTITTRARRFRSADGSMETVTRSVCSGTRFWWWCVPNPPGWETETTTEWVGDSATWGPLLTSEPTPTHVECQADVLAGEAGNGPSMTDGFPFQPSDPGAPDSEAYTAAVGDTNVSFGSVIYKWYTAHYLDYWNDDSIVSVPKSRLDVAKDTLNELINSNTSIDFGLAVFNDNSNSSTQYWCNGAGGPTYRTWWFGCPSGTSEVEGPDPDLDNGGRIVHAIIEGMTATDRAGLAGPTGIINGIVGDGWTPLCESTYEAYRYLAGKTEVYGAQQDDSSDPPWLGDSRLDTPDPDPRAYVGTTSQYQIPSSDCAYTYIILMTDGFPTFDEDANAAIELLTGETCGDYETDFFSGTERLLAKNCLPTITKYMANNDLDADDSNGDQFGITYTIGYATDQEMLEDAALNGKGEYYVAETPEALVAAFEGAVLSILSKESTFTSPAVAVNSFTRTETRNEVFFAMFKPDGSKDWKGNIKRLDIARRTVSGKEVLKFVDRGGVEAIDTATGLIKTSARTFWGTGTDEDGPLVDQGGVGALLAASDLTTRANRLWTNTGTDGALEKFDKTKLVPSAYGFVGLPTLFGFWNVVDQDELDEVIDWGIGYDTEDVDGDGSTTDNRPWILGDILHSRPTVVSYGALGSFDEDDPDLRLLVGTNTGFLHMFGNSDGVEDWAFFPKELGPLLTTRKNNTPGGGRPYGIDLQPVTYTLDVDRDGTIDDSDGDKIWVFMGLRRGGRAMYALDISDPATPVFMWNIDSTMPEFAELGQTWALPRITKIPGHVDGAGEPKPVLIFGAGYDPTTKDDHATLGSVNDTMGRGIFIVDAETGDLVWSVTPAANSATNMQSTSLLQSIPSEVGILDSNRDGLTDRIYVGDTGGKIWRVDMPGAALPTSAQDTWRITKLFDANGGTYATDRRFFAAPDVLRIIREGNRSDAILIGTGDRSNPADKEDHHAPGQAAAQNQFYMIRDLAVSPFTTDVAPGDAECSDPYPDFRCSLHLVPADLYDVTANTIQDAVLEADRTDAQDLLAAAQGWVLDLEGDGEKSLSRAITIKGKVLFETYTPGDGSGSSAGLCTPEIGTARLYVVNFYDATAEKDFNSDGDLEKGDRSLVIGNMIPDSPAIHVDDQGIIRIITPFTGGGYFDDGDLIDTGATIDRPFGTYWYREEY